MKKRFLGKTGIEVTELCFGALPMGPLQAKMPEEEGSSLILEALNQGINFIDTAEIYQTYPHIKKALDQFQGEVVIATKSTATTYEAMEKSLQNALQALGRDQIDIFLLHAAKAQPSVFEDRAGALQCLLDYQKKGFIKAVGISTHVIQIVEKAAQMSEIDVVFPIINQLGMGIVGGTKEEMLEAIQKVHTSGKGLYAMKALAGGHLIEEIRESFDFVRKIEGISSVAVGMVHSEELSFNLKFFNNELDASENILARTKSNKKLIITFLCVGCGTCLEVCPNSALSVIKGKAVVDENACLLCGYCNPICPEFALRLV
ncbi:MAG: aldo/keto reductase [Desulfitobacteriaceae bacterium]